MGDSHLGAREGMLLDSRRHRVSEERSPFRGCRRQYCGQLGKQDNCQVAVSLSLASPEGSLPIAFRLYLPEEWATDNARRRKTGVPEDIRFATKPDIAPARIRHAQEIGVPAGIVLADAGCGNSIDLREGLTAQGLPYCVGVPSNTGVWTKGRMPLPPKPRTSARGHEATRLRRASGHTPLSVKEMACQLPPSAWRTVTWRPGTNARLSSRFAALRVRAAHRDWHRCAPREEEWLLIDWPQEESEPVHYWLAHLPATMTRRALVSTAMMRGPIERDYQELKQEFGLSHYEGRGWRGSHHHATLRIAAYGFLLTTRLKTYGGCRKPPLDHKCLCYPKATRRVAAGGRQRHAPDSIATLRFLLVRAIVQTLDLCPCYVSRDPRRNL